MNRYIRLILSVSCGVMLSLPWLGFPGWMLFAAWLPLLLLDDLLGRNPRKSTILPFWSCAFVAFLVWNSLTTWWILHATLAGMTMAIFMNSLLMSVFITFAHMVRKNIKGELGYAAFIFFWISFEFAHYHWEIEWPWLNLGNGFSNSVKMVQWFEFTGTLGGTLWIWTINILLFIFLKEAASELNIRRLSATGSVLLITIITPILLSLSIYSGYQEPKIPRNILVIQPNIDPYSESHDETAVNEKLAKFIRITETSLNPHIDYIVGPETVFEQNWDEANLMVYPAFRALHSLTRKEGNRSLVIGVTTYRIYEDGEKAPPSARKSREGMRYDVFNTSLFTDPSGGYQAYHKSILVPGVEKMPFRKYLRFLDKLIINLGGTTGSLGIQREPVNFEAPNGDLIAPAICYESAFGGYIAEFVRKGAGIIFVITNDGWWKNTPGYRQHFSFSRLRAIETRRCVVRSANTGISGFINQRGDVIQQSEWWTEAAMEEQVNLNHEITFYVRYGDYIGRIAAFVSILLLLNLLVSWILNRKKKIRINSYCVKPR